MMDKDIPLDEEVNHEECRQAVSRLGTRSHDPRGYMGEMVHVDSRRHCVEHGVVDPVSRKGRPSGPPRGDQAVTDFRRGAAWRLLQFAIWVMMCMALPAAGSEVLNPLDDHAFRCILECCPQGSSMF